MRATLNSPSSHLYFILSKLEPDIDHKSKRRGLWLKHATAVIEITGHIRRHHGCSKLDAAD